MYFDLNLMFADTKRFPPLPTAIGNAYAVLSNPEKRQQYDQYGDQSAASNAPQQSSHSHPGYYRSFHRDFEADISPEELFNIFFGGRFPTGERFVCECLERVVSMIDNSDHMLKEGLCLRRHCKVIVEVVASNKFMSQLGWVM